MGEAKTVCLTDILFSSFTFSSCPSPLLYTFAMVNKFTASMPFFIYVIYYHVLVLPNYFLAPIILIYFSADHLYVLDILSAFKRLTLNVLLHKSCFLYTLAFLTAHHHNFMEYVFVVISCE